jgi:hypothetical protein
MDERIKLAAEAMPLTSGKVMREEIANMTLEEVASSFAILDIFIDMAEKRKKMFRDHLLEQAEAHGEEGDAGHNKLMINGTLVIRERREAKTPDTDGIQRLLESRKMPITSVFDERTVLELNVSKVEHLVKLGKLPKEEVDALKKITYALKVKPAPMLQQMLEEGELPQASKKRLT